jgi:hypothetical protein
MTVVDQAARALLRHVAEQGAVQFEPEHLVSSQMLSEAGLIRPVLSSHQGHLLVLTGRGVQLSGALPWQRGAV